MEKVIEKISYFELLDKIESQYDIPDRLRVSLVPGTSRIYIAEYDTDGSFLCYQLENKKYEDENYDFYLSNSFLESGMFDKTIEVIDLVFEDLTYFDDDAITLGQVRDKINDIICYLKENDR